MIVYRSFSNFNTYSSRKLLKKRHYTYTINELEKKVDLCHFKNAYMHSLGSGSNYISVRLLLHEAQVSWMSCLKQLFLFKTVVGSAPKRHRFKSGLYQLQSFLSVYLMFNQFNHLILCSANILWRQAK